MTLLSPEIELGVHDIRADKIVAVAHEIEEGDEAQAEGPQDSSNGDPSALTEADLAGAIPPSDEGVDAESDTPVPAPASSEADDATRQDEADDPADLSEGSRVRDILTRDESEGDTNDDSNPRDTDDTSSRSSQGNSASNSGQANSASDVTNGSSAESTPLSDESAPAPVTEEDLVGAVPSAEGDEADTESTTGNDTVERDGGDNANTEAGDDTAQLDGDTVTPSDNSSDEAGQSRTRGLLTPDRPSQAPDTDEANNTTDASDDTPSTDEAEPNAGDTPASSPEGVGEDEPSDVAVEDLEGAISSAEGDEDSADAASNSQQPSDSPAGPSQTDGVESDDNTEPSDTEVTDPSSAERKESLKDIASADELAEELKKRLNGEPSSTDGTAASERGESTGESRTSDLLRPGPASTDNETSSDASAAPNDNPASSSTLDRQPTETTDGSPAADEGESVRIADNPFATSGDKFEDLSGDPEKLQQLFDELSAKYPDADLDVIAELVEARLDGHDDVTPGTLEDLTGSNNESDDVTFVPTEEELAEIIEAEAREIIDEDAKAFDEKIEELEKYISDEPGAREELEELLKGNPRLLFEDGALEDSGLMQDLVAEHEARIEERIEQLVKDFGEHLDIDAIKEAEGDRLGRMSEADFEAFTTEQQEIYEGNKREAERTEQFNDDFGDLLDLDKWLEESGIDLRDANADFDALLAEAQEVYERTEQRQATLSEQFADHQGIVERELGDASLVDMSDDDFNELLIGITNAIAAEQQAEGARQSLADREESERAAKQRAEEAQQELEDAKEELETIQRNAMLAHEMADAERRVREAELALERAERRRAAEAVITSTQRLAEAEAAQKAEEEAAAQAAAEREVAEKAEREAAEQREREAAESQEVIRNSDIHTLSAIQVNDPDKLASAIDQYIDKYAPTNSPLRGMGRHIVDGSIEAGVNPFVLVGIAQKESSFGTAGIATIGTHNAFGRTATDSQPHIETSRKWYEYPSWAESFFANGTDTHPDYMRRVFLGNGKDDIADVVYMYAPPHENNSALYVNQLEGWIDEMAELAGDAISTN